MSDIGDDVEAKAAVSGDRFVEGRVKDRNEGLEVRPLAAGAKADSRPVSRRRHLHEDVHAEIHPDAVEGFLDGRCDARLARPRGAVENDDLAGDWHGNLLAIADFCHNPMIVFAPWPTVSRPTARSATSGRRRRPAGEAERARSGHRYLIQKHDATRLHFDFRLEHDGVLALLGGDARAELRPEGQAAGGPRRGPPARLRRLRGDHPRGQLRRRHGDAVGRGHVGAGGRPGRGARQGRLQVHPPRRAAEGEMGARPHQEQSRQALQGRQLAAHQGARRIRRDRRRSRSSSAR